MDVPGKIEQNQFVKRESSKRMTSKERKKQILEVAWRLFAGANYEVVSNKQIARSVGVSEPVIYHYFPSKKALYVEVLKSRREFWLNALRNVTEQFPDPFAIIMRIMETQTKNQEALDRIWDTARLVDDSGVQLELKLFYEGMFNLAVEILEKAMGSGKIRNDLKPQGLAMLIVSLLSTGSHLAMSGLMKDGEGIYRAAVGLIEEIMRNREQC